ncbi:retrovirus-related pol polyprotein from transposon TNT 1-94 [Tanacetum coccineum]|uniref:Retrovirus-related pol polyprotein from transposon TNT 1-94 n=1 Tax=Tanacetum coccineum TaxID=301880 RepID=A0ABQ5JBF1_9ASTR
MHTRAMAKELSAASTHKCLFVDFLSKEEPKKVSEALKHPGWVDAMQEELNQFARNKVWTLVPPSYGKTIIGYKWIFINKRDKVGIVIKNKVWLVAQGYNQQEGIDYDETFDLVTRVEAIRIFLAFATYMNFTESAKTLALTPNSIIVRPDVDDNFVINSTNLNMIRENNFDGYLRVDPHDDIHEFLAICDMFKYGETQSEALKLLIFPFSMCDEAKTCFNELNEESISPWEQMRRTLDELTQGILDEIARGIFLYKTPNQAFQFLDDKVIKTEILMIRILAQTYHDPNDSEKSLIELNNDVKQDLEHFKSCIHSMRTVHDKLFDKDDGKPTGVLPNKKSKTVNQEPQSETDFKKSITKFLDG